MSSIVQVIWIDFCHRKEIVNLMLIVFQPDIPLAPITVNIPIGTHLIFSRFVLRF
jgi:hypothetical protein